MPNDLVHLTCRIPAEVRERLDDIAKQRRMETGENVTVADLVREALGEFVDRHKA
jgi:hypothetical protein